MTRCAFFPSIRCSNEPASQVHTSQAKSARTHQPGFPRPMPDRAQWESNQGSAPLETVDRSTSRTAVNMPIREEKDAFFRPRRMDGE